MDIFIVRNAAVVPYLRDGPAHRDTAQLPVLPPEVTRIEVTWMAEDDVVRPSFERACATSMMSVRPSVCLSVCLCIYPEAKPEYSRL